MKSRPNKFAHCADTFWQPLPCGHAFCLPKQDLHNLIHMVVEILVFQGRLARPLFRRGLTQHLAGWPVCDSQEVTKFRVVRDDPLGVGGRSRRSRPNRVKL